MKHRILVFFSIVLIISAIDSKAVTRNKTKAIAQTKAQKQQEHLLLVAQMKKLTKDIQKEIDTRKKTELEKRLEDIRQRLNTAQS